MNRMIIRSSVLLLALLGFTNTAVSHHPPRFARCKLTTISGELERIQWTNPHVLLFIRTDSGETQEVGWLNLQSLARAGIDANTLHVGDRLVVEGGIRPNDASHEPILVTSIRRTTDGWEWSRRPQGC